MNFKSKEPEVILDSVSAICNVEAFVEKSETTYYFYLWINPGTEQSRGRACWLCNRTKAPKKLDVKAMKSGKAPMNPAQYVGHDPAGMELDADKMEIVWFAEGDSAALLYEGNILAAIPGWIDEAGFPGFSRYAKGTGPCAWETEQAHERLSQKIKKSKRQWELLDTDYWPDVQKKHMKALEDFFGAYQKYYAIDGGEFPPKALVTGEKADVTYGITAGVSCIAMPNVESQYDEEEHYRRMELGFAAASTHRDLGNAIYPVMSGLARMPWEQFTFLGHGHTIPCPQIEGFSYLLFVNAREVPEISSPQYDVFLGEEINLLWIVPITEKEYQYEYEHGVEKLLEKASDPARIHIFDGTGKFFGS